MVKLTIEKIPTSVPPLDCVYSDGEEATYRVYREGNTQTEKAVICNNHMRKYLLEVVNKLSEET